MLTALSSRQACTPEGRRRRSVGGARSRFTESRLGCHPVSPPRRLTLIPLKEEATSSGRSPRGSLGRPRDSVAARELFAKKRRKRTEKRTGASLAWRNTPGNRIQVHLGQIGGSSIHYSIWRSRPSSLEGEPNRGGRVNPDAAKRRRRQRPICGRRCRPSNGEQSASRASPVAGTLAPLCSPLGTACVRTCLYCVAMAGDTCRRSACRLLVPTPDQAQCALGPRHHIALIGLDGLFCSQIPLWRGSRAITGSVLSCNRERDGYEFDYLFNILYIVEELKSGIWGASCTGITTTKNAMT